MIKSTGAILLSDHSDRAIFIQPDEIAAFRELIALILSAPTVAGPPLITKPIADLAAKLDVPDMVADITQPTAINLTTVDEEVLTLLRHQIALREKLPLRIERTCVTCGKTKILNPNMVVKSKNLENFGSVAGAVIETAALVAEGHHIRAVIKVMGSVSTIAGKNQSEIPACEDCQGQEFATPAVTYCPHCRKLRSETVLIECPDCQTSFIDAETLSDAWQSKSYAYGAFHRTANLAHFAVAAHRFESKLNGDQRKYIEAAFTPDEDLIGACRCGRPGETLRAVALVLTSRKLIWSRQLGTGPMTGGIVMWPTITGIRTFPGAGTEVTLQIETSEGLLTFTGLRGTGVTFGALVPAYTGDGLGQLIGQFANVEVIRALPPAPVYAAHDVPPTPTSAPPSPVSPDGFAPSVFAPVPHPTSAPPATAMPMPSGPVSPAHAVPVPSASPFPALAASTPPVLAAPPVSAPPVSAPPVSGPPLSTPPVATPPVSSPPVSAPPVSAPPVSSPPVSAPPVATARVSSPPVSAPPVAEAPVWAAPVSGPPVSGPPVPSNPMPSNPMPFNPVSPIVTAPVSAPEVTPPVSAPPPLLPTVSTPPVSAPPMFDRTAIVGYDPPPVVPVADLPGVQDPTPPITPPPPPLYGTPPSSAPPYSGAPYSGAPYSSPPNSGPPYTPPQQPQYTPTPQFDYAAAEPPPAPATAGWYADPFGQYQWRWWNGTTWTKTFHR